MVDGRITQSSKVAASAEATRNGNDVGENVVETPANSESDTEISAAVAVGIYDNDARAIISGGAVTDARGQTRVHAEVEYPLLMASPGDAINPITTIERSGLEGVGLIMDGTLGLSQMFNVNVTTLAGEDDAKLSLAGGVAVTDYTNNVIARVDDNASVNQNIDLTAFQPSVSVQADLKADFIEVGQMAAFNLDLEGFVNAVSKGAQSGNPLDFMKQLVNPFGVTGKNAAGGVLLVTLADNDVLAEINDAARVTGGGGDHGRRDNRFLLACGRTDRSGFDRFRVLRVGSRRGHRQQDTRVG